jgi:hypothetical protein
MDCQKCYDNYKAELKREYDEIKSMFNVQIDREISRLNPDDENLEYNKKVIEKYYNLQIEIKYEEVEKIIKRKYDIKY